MLTSEKLFMPQILGGFLEYCFVLFFQGGNTFSFFSDSSEDKDRQSKEIKLHDKPNILELEKITKWKAPLQLVQNLPYDSSATESEGENEGPGDSKGVTSGPKTFHKRHIFYHVENREMMKTLEGEKHALKLCLSYV